MLLLSLGNRCSLLLSEDFSFLFTSSFLKKRSNIPAFPCATFKICKLSFVIFRPSSCNFFPCLAFVRNGSTYHCLFSFCTYLSFLSKIPSSSTPICAPSCRQDQQPLLPTSLDLSFNNSCGGGDPSSAKQPNSMDEAASSTTTASSSTTTSPVRSPSYEMLREEALTPCADDGKRVDEEQGLDLRMKFLTVSHLDVEEMSDTESLGR